MREFRDRVAVVTGGGGGIGAAIAWRLARAGMKIVVADVDAAAAVRVRAGLEAQGHVATAVHTDVADGASVENLASLAYDSYGSVDLLCNNAGVVPSGRHRPVWEYPPEDWRWVFEVNLMGVVHGLRSFVPRMLAQNRPGHIINTASVAGFISGSGSPVYSASKHAVVRVTEALYAALAERQSQLGVTVLCPGIVNTRIYESERNRPERFKPAGGIAAETAAMQAVAANLYGNALSPEAVAEQAFAAVCENRLYQFSSGSFDDAIRDRSAAILERRNPRFPDLLDLSTRDRHVV